MDNDAFRSLVGLTPIEASSSTIAHQQSLPRTPSCWPELKAYDGRMAARAIQHDRPDVTVIVIQEEDWTEQHDREISEQYALSESSWEASAAPLDPTEKRTMELVVLLCVRQCRRARAHDTVVTEAPFVMRRSLMDASGADAVEAVDGKDETGGVQVLAHFPRDELQHGSHGMDMHMGAEARLLH